MAYQYLFSKVPIKHHIHRMKTELNTPELIANHYAKTIRRILNLKKNALPSFDLIYLGIGEDAHTASLMPGTRIVKDYADIENLPQPDPLILAVWVPQLNTYRFTMTPSVINNSQSIIFLVTGNTKQQAVWNVLEGSQNPIQYPAQLIHCKHRKTQWYLDISAAARLPLNVFPKDK